jgi:hypothetical protein
MTGSNNEDPCVMGLTARRDAWRGQCYALDVNADGMSALRLASELDATRPAIWSHLQRGMMHNQSI